MKIDNKDPIRYSHGKLGDENKPIPLVDKDGNTLLHIVFDMNNVNDPLLVQYALDIIEGIIDGGNTNKPYAYISPLPWTLMNANYRDCFQHVIDANLGRPFYFVTKTPSPTIDEEKLMNNIVRIINER